MEEATSTSLYEKLKTLRRARGLSVQKLADKMGENHQKVGRMERGQTNLTIDYLIKLSKALDTPIDDIFKDSTSSKSEEPKDNSSLLSTIVLWVEKNADKLNLTGQAEKKAALVSHIYSQALKVPQAGQQFFLETFFTTFELIA